MEILSRRLKGDSGVSIRRSTRSTIPYTRFPTPRSSPGFTVIEILVAVTIFAIVSVVIFAIFRAAVTSSAKGDTEANIMQQARFALDSVENDFSSIYFRDETSYNVAITRMVQDMEQARLQAESQNDYSQFYALYGDPTADPKDDKPTIGNPYEKGRLIDLQMQGTDSGESDKVSFPIYEPMAVGGVYRPWGLTRVEYSLEKGILLRVSKTVQTQNRDPEGNPIGNPEIPQVSKVAEGVVGFNVAYAFWYDNTWYETDNWNSANRQIRNANYMIGSYDDEDARQQEQQARQGQQQPAGMVAFGPGDAGYNDSLNDSESEPLDRLPTYARVTLTLSDPKDQNHTRVFERLIYIPPAQETYVPLQTIAEDRREHERDLRDDQYRTVLPGVGKS
ncbi:hypothetical protein BH09SUM1_BH09SUM1_24370 [soil metagenome]